MWKVISQEISMISLRNYRDPESLLHCVVTKTKKKKLHISNASTTTDADTLKQQKFSLFTRAKKSLNKLLSVSQISQIFQTIQFL